MAGKDSVRISFSVNFKWIALALLLALLTCLMLWRPWQGAGISDEREVTVTGSATVKATPDSFVFYPTYEFKNADKDQALQEVGAKQETVVKGLKTIGVADRDIKTDTGGYRNNFYQNDSKEYVYTLTLQVITSDKTKAQKIQDTLVATGPSGQVSPQAQFSPAKQKELESKARIEASADARKKADQMASNIGFRVGKVKSIQDGSLYGGGPIMAMEGDAMAKSVAPTSSQTSLSIHPGENELPYTIQVTYYIR